LWLRVGLEVAEDEVEVPVLEKLETEELRLDEVLETDAECDELELDDEDSVLDTEEPDELGLVDGCGCVLEMELEDEAGFDELLEIVELVELDGFNEDDEELDGEDRDESWYISSLFPAPQYSYWLPGQIKLQSPMFSMTDPVLIELPQ
jgi:hypothetical protein